MCLESRTYSIFVYIVPINPLPLLIVLTLDCLGRDSRTSRCNSIREDIPSTPLKLDETVLTICQVVESVVRYRLGSQLMEVVQQRQWCHAWLVFIETAGGILRSIKRGHLCCR